MKRLTNCNNITKGIAFTAVLFFAALLFSSCKKDSSTNTDTVSDDEVAEAVTESVSASSGGLSTQSESSAFMASTTTLACGGSSDTTITGHNVTGTAIVYNYALTFNRSVTCTAGIPSLFTSNFTGSSSYTALRMSSNDNSNAQVTVSGLQPSASNYIINANYVRNGTQQSSVRYQRSFASIITITSTDITVAKSTMKIISGSATVQFTATGSGGTTTTRGGTITFLGGGKATLALNNGGSYTIQW